MVTSFKKEQRAENGRKLKNKKSRTFKHIWLA